MDASTTIAALSLVHNGTLTLNATNNSVLTVTSAVTVGSGQALAGNGTLNAALNVSGGTMSGSYGGLTVGGALAMTSGVINGGTFNSTATISGGTVNNGVFNGAIALSGSGDLSNGTYNGSVTAVGGEIDGGTFGPASALVVNGDVSNDALTLYGQIAPASTTINAGGILGGTSSSQITGPVAVNGGTLGGLVHIVGNVSFAGGTITGSPVVAGTAAVNSGTLTLSGPFVPTGGITVANGATITGTGSAGDLHLNSGAIATGTFNVTTYHYNLGFVMEGNASFGGAHYIDVNATSSITLLGGTFTGSSTAQNSQGSYGNYIGGDVAFNDPTVSGTRSSILFNGLNQVYGSLDVYDGGVGNTITLDGGTQINSGSVNLYSGTLTVASTGTITGSGNSSQVSPCTGLLNLQGTISGNLRVNGNLTASGGMINPGGVGTIGWVRVSGNLGLSNATLNCDLGSTNDLIYAGSVSSVLTGTVNVNVLSSNPGFGAGQYYLIVPTTSWSSLPDVSGLSASVSGVTPSSLLTYTMGADSGGVYLNVARNTSVGATFTFQSTSGNWTDSSKWDVGYNLYPTSPDQAVFNLSTTDTWATVTGSQSVSTLTLNGSGNLVLWGSGSLGVTSTVSAGSGQMVSGMATLNANVALSGGTLGGISGTLIVGGGVTVTGNSTMNNVSFTGANTLSHRLRDADGDGQRHRRRQCGLADRGHADGHGRGQRPDHPQWRHDQRRPDAQRQRDLHRRQPGATRINGAISHSTGTLNVTGTVGGSGSFTATSGTVNGTGTINRTVTLTGATLAGTLTVGSVNSTGGTFNPGQQDGNAFGTAGTINVTNNLTLDSASVLTTTWARTLTSLPSANPDGGGHADVNAMSGFGVGTYQLLSYGNLNGSDTIAWETCPRATATAWAPTPPARRTTSTWLSAR